MRTPREGISMLCLFTDEEHPINAQCLIQSTDITMRSVDGNEHHHIASIESPW